MSARPTLSTATDYERHAMGLEALGINPYSGTGVDYITPIVNKFDGTQIGDAALSNDDIFAMLALMHAGYSPNDPLIQKETDFILSMQNPDGSWDKNSKSADMTAAALQALGPMFSVPSYGAKLGPAFGKAVGYLASTQQQDGGWFNIDSTSWVQILINSVVADDPPQAPAVIAALKKNGVVPMDFIAHAQQSDGSVNSSLPIWSTAYAVTAAGNGNWIDSLQLFQKPVPQVGGGVSGGGSSSGQVLGVSTSTATTTPSVATSTEPIATSTPTTATSTTDIIGTTTIMTIGSTTTETPPVPKPKKIVPKKTIAPKTTPVSQPENDQQNAPTDNSSDTTQPQTNGFIGKIKGFFSWLAHLI